VIDGEQWYRVTFETTDLAQRVVDFHSSSIDRLSNGRGLTPVDPDKDPKARVRCVQSAYIARRDYYRHPEWFQLDIVPKVGEQVSGGVAVGVVVDC
jgi:hypothetical protein